MPLLAREVASLVLRFYQKLDYLDRQGLPVDLDRPVLSFTDDFEPMLTGRSGSDIPGYAPVGYVSAMSLVRLYSRRDVAEALATLASKHPALHDVLTAHLAPPALGATIATEWADAVRLHARCRALRASLRSGDLSDRRAQAVALQLAKLEARAATVAPATRELLDAAQALANILPARQWA